MGCIRYPTLISGESPFLYNAVLRKRSLPSASAEQQTGGIIPSALLKRNTFSIHRTRKAALSRPIFLLLPLDKYSVQSYIYTNFIVIKCV